MPNKEQLNQEKYRKGDAHTNRKLNIPKVRKPSELDENNLL